MRRRNIGLAIKIKIKKDRFGLSCSAEMQQQSWREENCEIVAARDPPITFPEKEERPPATPLPDYKSS